MGKDENQTKRMAARRKQPPQATQEDDGYVARRSNHVSGDKYSKADGDSWQETLAVCELAGKLTIRSYFTNQRTQQRVWDEPPSGASKIIAASESMRKMANVQLQEMQIATGQVPDTEHKPKEKKGLGGLFRRNKAAPAAAAAADKSTEAKITKDGRKVHPRIQYKPDGLMARVRKESRNQTVHGQHLDPALQKALAASLHPHSPHADHHDEEMAKAMAMSLAESSGGDKRRAASRSNSPDPSSHGTAHSERSNRSHHRPNDHPPPTSHHTSSSHGHHAAAAAAAAPHDHRSTSQDQHRSPHDRHHAPLRSSSGEGRHSPRAHHHDHSTLARSSSDGHSSRSDHHHHHPAPVGRASSDAHARARHGPSGHDHHSAHARPDHHSFAHGRPSGHDHHSAHARPSGHDDQSTTSHHSTHSSSHHGHHSRSGGQPEHQSSEGSHKRVTSHGQGGSEPFKKPAEVHGHRRGRGRVRSGSEEEALALAKALSLSAEEASGGGKAKSDVSSLSEEEQLRRALKESMEAAKSTGHKEPKEDVSMYDDHESRVSPNHGQQQKVPAKPDGHHGAKAPHKSVNDVSNNNKPSAATLQAASEATRARGRSPFRGNDTRTKTSHSAEPVRRRGGGANADVIEDPVLRAFLEVPDHGKPVRHGSEDRSLSRSRASTRSPVCSRTSRSNSPTPPLKRSVHPQAGGDPRGKQHHPPPHQPSRPVGPPSRGPSLPVYLNQKQGAAPPHDARSTSSSPRRDGKGLRAIPDDTGPSRKVTELDRVKAAQEQQMVLAAIAANLQGGDTQAQSQQTVDKGMREPNPPMSDGAAHIDDEEAALLKALEASRRETARIEERLAQLRRAKRIG